MAQSVLSVYAELLSTDRTSSSKHLSAGLIRPAGLRLRAGKTVQLMGIVKNSCSCAAQLQNAR
jgi:hypothetical protein